MEPLKPLSDFFSAIEKDGRIRITHIAIYAALLQYWKDQGFRNPIIAFSNDIMKVARISSPATYHKCMKDLHAFGYVQYEPSFKRNSGSKIFFFENEKSLMRPPSG